MKPKKVNRDNKVPVFSIDKNTFKHKFFTSQSDAGKFYNTTAREVSRIINKDVYTCYKEVTFVKGNSDIDVEIEVFKKKREKLNSRKITLPDFRKCSKCKNELELNNSNFRIINNDINIKYIKNKFSRTCNDCERIENQKFYLNKKDKEKFNNDLKAKSILKIYKGLDKKYNREFSLSLEWIKDNINKLCIYCNFPSEGGIDRIDNLKGHVENNCVPCCKICNVARMNNFTSEEFKLIGNIINQIKTNRLNESNT